MKSYDKDKPSKCIVYEDSSNLYGWAKSKCLPVGRFKWLKHADNLYVNKINKDSSKGYILEIILNVLKNYTT